MATAPESRAQAFPVHDLPPGRASAAVLEGLLQHVAGVTRAYVSPVTALAYVDYVPAQVTEEQLVGAMRRGGYQVGGDAQRFDWRHGHPG
jgi:copper chaperone CopZ